MSKIGNHVVGIKESPDYRAGWESAERGDPILEPALGFLYAAKIEAFRMGWQDYHAQEQRP